jgi:hypothetical protein
MEVYVECPSSCDVFSLIHCGNILACILHLTLFVVTLSVSDIDTTVPVYDVQYNILTNNGSGWRISPHISSQTGALNLTIVTAFFFLISALFHAGNSFVWRRTYVAGIRDCRCPSRWVEYAFSAALMQIVLSYVSGLVFVVDIVYTFTLTVCTMAFGYVQELVNRPSHEGDAWKLSGLAKVQVHLLGWVPFGVTWGILFYKFYELAGSPSTPVDNGETRDMPSFVYAVVWSQLVLFLLFAVTQLVQACLKPSAYPWGELCFILLSFVSKATLGGLLLGNVLVLGKF